MHVRSAGSSMCGGWDSRRPGPGSSEPARTQTEHFSIVDAGSDSGEI